MITITHKPTNRKIQFGAPREAANWLKRYTEQKLNTAELDIESPVPLSYYGDQVPEWAGEIAEIIYSEYNHSLPPVKWMNKGKMLSRGTTFYKSGGGTATRINISAGIASVHLKGIFLHEIAHTMVLHSEGHGHAFYMTLFKLCRRFLTLTEEKAYMEETEFRYMKSSKYWYACFYDLREILKGYSGYCRDCGSHIRGGEQHLGSCSLPRPKSKVEQALDLMWENA